MSQILTEKWGWGFQLQTPVWHSSFHSLILNTRDRVYLLEVGSAAQPDGEVAKVCCELNLKITKKFARQKKSKVRAEPKNLQKYARRKPKVYAGDLGSVASEFDLSTTV